MNNQTIFKQNSIGFVVNQDLCLDHIPRSRLVDPILAHTRPPNSTLLFCLKQTQL